MVITGVIIGRYFYWHTGTVGQFDRYDEHGAAIVTGSLAWPIGLPLILIYLITMTEPRSIRKARQRKELKEFAKREGLEL